MQPRAVEQFAGIPEVEEHEQTEHVFKVFSQDKVQQREVEQEVPRGAGGRLELERGVSAWKRWQETESEG